MAISLDIYRKRYGEAAEFLSNYRNKHNNKMPWEKAYYNIRSRCGCGWARKYKYYGAIGIKCEVKSRDLKESYLKERAWLLAKPSVDRIDPTGNYTKENIRWIEFSENRKKRGLRYPLKKAMYEKFKKTTEDLFSLEKVETYWQKKYIREYLRFLLTKSG